jgi:phosphate uptake regulator
MTPKNNKRPRTDDLLEDILERVESIDANVERILDQLTDHLFEARYGPWPDGEHLNDSGFA